MTNEAKLFDAIEADDVQKARDLVQANPKVASARTPEGVSALMMALYYRRTEIAALLRNAIPDLDLFEAAATGDLERLRFLLAEEGGAGRRSGDGFTALHLACFFGKPDVARLLVEHGADVNAVANNPSQVRPIHSAVAGPPETQVEVLELLLAAGAEADSTQAGGWTALMAVAKHGMRGAIDLLLKAGADPLRAADDGQTARSMATDEVRDLLGE